MSSVEALIRRLRSEQAGVTIIEVMVSALVLAILSTGVLTGLDGAQNISSKSRLRSVAAGLAQADQERLRGFRAQELSNIREPREKKLDGTTYKIFSRGDWVSNSSGVAECSGATARADYMRISSTVTWEGMGALKPITLDSIVAPPTGSFGDEGSVAVQIGDRDDTGLPGVAVTVTGAKTLTTTTNDSGCAFFGYLPPGNYTISFSKPGYITPAGVTDVSDQTAVVQEETVTVPYRYDRPANVTVSANTRKGAGAPLQATTLGYASLGNSGLPSGLRTMGNGALTPSHTFANVFPFTDGYSAFSGNCTGANPAGYSTPVTASDTVPGTQAAATVTPALAAPGGSTSVTVREPAVRLWFRYDTGANDVIPAPAGTTVKLTATGSGCGGTATHTTDANGWVDAPEPSVPVGTYSLCWEIYFYGWYSHRLSARKIQNPDGVEFKPTSLPTSGRC